MKIFLVFWCGLAIGFGVTVYMKYASQKFAKELADKFVKEFEEAVKGI